MESLESLIDHDHDHDLVPVVSVAAVVLVGTDALYSLAVDLWW